MSSIPHFVTPLEPWVEECPENDGRFREYRADCQPEYNEWRDKENFAKQLSPEISFNNKPGRIGRNGPLAEHQKAKARFVKKFGSCSECKRRKMTCPQKHFPPAYERIYQTSGKNTNRQTTPLPSDIPFLVPAELRYEGDLMQGLGDQFHDSAQNLSSFDSWEPFASDLSLIKIDILWSADSQSQSGIDHLDSWYFSQLEALQVAARPEYGHLEADRIFFAPWLDNLDYNNVSSLTASSKSRSSLTASSKSTCADSGYGTESSTNGPKKVKRIHSFIGYGHVNPAALPHIQSPGDVNMDKKFITALCRIILEAVGWTGDKRLWHSISQGLPHLIRTFALRLAACSSAQDESSAQATQGIMLFIHQNHIEIAVHLAVSSMEQYDEEQSGGAGLNETGTRASEKLDYWRRKFYMQETLENTDSYEGAPNLGDSKQTVSFERYRDLVTSSDAFKWLVTTLKTFLASSYQEMNGLAMTDISNKVLSVLNTGQVNRRREPQIHRIMYHIPWFVQDKQSPAPTSLRSVPRDILLGLHTVVGTLTDPQELDCLTYAQRVWPFGGEEIAFAFIEALQDGFESGTSAGKCVRLGDRTELIIQKYSDHVFINAKGLASSLSLCAEQLAWLGATFHCLHQTHPMKCTPRIETRVASQIAGADNGPGPYTWIGYIVFNIEPLVHHSGPHQSQHFPWNTSMVVGYPRLQSLTSLGLVPPQMLSLPTISGTESSKLSDNLTPPFGGSDQFDSTTQLIPPNSPASYGTIVSSSETSSAEEWESDILSISEESSLSIPVTDDPTILAILERVKVSLAEEFLNDYGCAPGSSSQGASTGTTIVGSASANSRGPSNKSISSRTTSKKLARHCHGQNDGHDEDSGEEEAGEPKSKKRKILSKRTRFLACPYSKLDPQRHRRCLIRKITRAKDIKLHLSRVHAPDHYCDRCGTICEDESSYDAHRESLCEKNPREVMITAMSPARRNAISKKSAYNSSDEFYWYGIWDCLFPGCSRPDNIYMSDGLLEYAGLLEIYCRENYSSALRQQMATARSSLPPGWESSSGFSESHLDFIFGGVFDILFANWRNQESQAAYTDDQGMTSLPPASIFMTSVEGTSGLTVPVEASTGAPLPISPADMQEFINPQDLQLHREVGNMQSFNNDPGLVATYPGQQVQFQGFDIYQDGSGHSDLAGHPL